MYNKVFLFSLSQSSFILSILSILNKFRTTYIENRVIKGKDNSVKSIKTLNINRNKNAEISSIMYIFCNFFFRS